MSNGSVWDITFNNQFKTMSKNFLIKLPKYRKYFVFTTQSGVLNFVRDDISSNIIQYHDKLNKQGHMMIPKSAIQFKGTETSFNLEASIFDKIYFKHGVQVGNTFWLMEGHSVPGPHDNVGT